VFHVVLGIKDCMMVKKAAQALLVSVISMNGCSAMEEEKKEGRVYKCLNWLAKKTGKKKVQIIEVNALNNDEGEAHVKSAMPKGECNIINEGRAYDSVRKKLFYDHFVIKEVVEEFFKGIIFPKEIRQLISWHSANIANETPIIYSFPSEKTLEEKVSGTRNDDFPFTFNFNKVKITLFHKIGFDTLDTLTFSFTHPDLYKPGLRKIFHRHEGMPVCIYNEYLTDTFYESWCFKIEGFYNFLNQPLDFSQYNLIFMQRTAEGNYKSFDLPNCELIKIISTDEVGFLLRKKETAFRPES
jgi:hypothetical protein